jgi:pimeloyl-ACP methyl ester carboxylesterase
LRSPDGRSAVRLSHLTEEEKRAYVIADNKLALNAGWDRELLAIELQGLVDLDFDIELTGFSLAEVDIVLDEARESSTEGAEASAEDAIPAYRHDGPTVTQPGDLWTLGRHKLVCGDARETAAYATLLGDEIVDLICTDPPYNVPINGHVCGSGRIRHRNFAMGVGEMNQAQFTRFLVDTLTPAATRFSKSPYGRSTSRVPRWVDAKRIGCPVYIVSGGKDRLIPASLVRKVARLYRQAIQRDYPTRGHWVIDDEDTDEMVRSICGWLQPIQQKQEHGRHS